MPALGVYFPTKSIWAVVVLAVPVLRAAVDVMVEKAITIVVLMYVSSMLKLWSRQHMSKSHTLEGPP